MNERERIGAKIKEERKKRGLTQQQLAELSQIQRANIIRIEQGKYSAGFDILQRIASAMNMKIDLI
jgi:transcriptional regulator with XRE-family HTH domain